MKHAAILATTLACLASAGCSSSFWGGAATGAVGTSAAYELTGQKQLHDLEEERKQGKITEQEYEYRKQQIQSGHLIK